MNQDFDNIGNIFREGFEGYSVEPSKSLWASISHKLWLQGFIRFSAGSFNVYYASGILVASIVGSVAVINNFSSEEIATITDTEKTIRQELEMPAWLEIKDNYYPQEYFSEASIEDGKLNSRPKPRKIKTKTTAQALSHIPDVKPNPTLQNNEYTAEGKPEKAVGAVMLKDKKAETPLQKSISSKPIKNAADQKKSVETGTNLQSSEKNNPLAEEIILKPGVAVKNEIAETQEIIEQQEILQQEKTVYDTIFFYDTLIHYDTVSVRLPRKKTKAKISVDLFGGPNTSGFVYKHDIAGFEDTLNSYTSASPGYQAGLKVNFHLNKFEFTSGLSYQQIEEDFNYNELTSENNPIEYWQYYEIEPLHVIDTVDWIFVFDPDDSSFVSAPLIQETWTTQFDSNLVEIPVHTTVIRNYNNRNKYTYLNIPLLMGYKFYDRDKISFTAKAGGNIGIFINAKGKGISWADRKSVIQLDKDKLPFIKTNFSWLLGLAVNYRFDEKISVVLEPWYRGSLNSMFDNKHPVSAKTNLLGINVGLRFHL